MKINSISLVSLLILSACVVTSQTGFYAYRANTTNAQKANDSLNCDVEALQKVPTNQQIATTPVYHAPIFVTPRTTTCSGYSCYTSGGQVTGGQTYGGNTFSYDSNTSLRQDVQAQCMTRKGYTLVQTKVCTSSQKPKNFSASMNDKVIKPEGDFCVAMVTDRLGVPVPLD